MEVSNRTFRQLQQVCSLPGIIIFSLPSRKRTQRTFRTSHKSTFVWVFALLSFFNENRFSILSRDFYFLTYLFVLSFGKSPWEM